MSPTSGYTDPSSRGSNKAKAMTELSKWEKQDQSVHRYYNVRKKIIDGKTKLVWQLEGCGPMEVGKASLPREYTKFSEFRAALMAQVDGIRDQLGADTD